MWLGQDTEIGDADLYVSTLDAAGLQAGIADAAFATMRKGMVGRPALENCSRHATATPAHTNRHSSSRVHAFHRLVDGVKAKPLSQKSHR